MEWWGISGSWRLTSAEVERDVRQSVRAIIDCRSGIVSGGALNVDYFATDEALKLCPSGHQIKIIIPTSLDVYAEHFRRRAKENVISIEQVEDLIAQLEKIKNIGSLQEMSFDACNEITYYARNTAVINASTALLAFQVNNSVGVQDTINKARHRGMKIILKQCVLSL
jgi:hypothetical protein